VRRFLDLVCARPFSVPRTSSATVRTHPSLQLFSAIVACLLLTFAMGALHAFSALLHPIERETGADRWAVSLVYSTGLLSVTAAVFCGHRMYRRLEASRLVLLAAALPMLGVVLTSTGTWAGWIVGYGVFFGFASGIGYGFALHAASCAVPDHRQGAAIGAVTASYALGAFGFSFLYPVLLGRFGLTAGYFISALVVSGLALIAAFLFFTARLNTQRSDDSGHITIERSAGGLFRLWLAYAMGAFAGLMVLGHAVPIMQTSGNSMSAAMDGLAVLSLGNAVAGLCVGLLADRLGARGPLVVIALVSAAALSGLAYSIVPTISMVFIGLAGAMYGAFIALYPLLVATWSGVHRAAWAYGRVFTAWGIAGVTAQPVAGWLFELTGNYRAPLLLAASLSLVAALTIASVTSQAQTTVV